MPTLHYSSEEEDAINERMDAHADDPDAWEELPPLPDEEAERLRGTPRGAHFSIRTSAEVFSALCAAATERGIGPSTLARELIEAGLAPGSRRITVELVVNPDGTVAAATAERAA